MKIFKISISFILPMLLFGCLGVAQRYFENKHPYKVGEYVRKIDSEHYEWIIIDNHPFPFDILVFRYYSANEWFLKDKNGIGILTSDSRNDNEFRYYNFEELDNNNLSSIDLFIDKFWRDDQSMVIEYSDQPIVATKTYSYSKISKIYIDINRVLLLFPEVYEFWFDDGRNGVAYDCLKKEFIAQKTGREIEAISRGPSVKFRSKDLKSIKKFFMTEATEQ